MIGWPNTKRPIRVEVHDPDLRISRSRLSRAIQGLRSGDCGSSVVVAGIQATRAVLHSARDRAQESGADLLLAFGFQVCGLPEPLAHVIDGVGLLPVPLSAVWNADSGDHIALALSALPEAELEAPLMSRAVPLVHALGEVLPEARDKAKAIESVVGRTHFEPDPYGRRKGLTGHELLAVLDTLDRRATMFGERPAFAYGVRHWNRSSVAAALCAPGSKVTFCKGPQEAIAAARRERGRVLAWAGQALSEHENAARDAGVAFWRIEDGFLRSVGLARGWSGGRPMRLTRSGSISMRRAPAASRPLSRDANCL